MLKSCNSVLKRSVAIVGMILASCGFSAQAAQNISLQWDRSIDTNVAGYAMYIGGASGSYSSRIDVGTNSTTTLSGLSNGTTYYFMVTAYDSSAVESAPSNEAKFIASNNNPPTLAAISNRTVAAMSYLVVTNSGSDPDKTNHITYSLDAGAPTNMTINAVSGLIFWPVPLSYGGTTNAITVRVTDNGVPPLSATQTFNVVVSNYVQLVVGTSILTLGQTSSVPITLNSSVGVTNLSFVLNVPGDRVTNFTLQSLVTTNATMTQVTNALGVSTITVKANSGSSLQGPITLGQFNFKAVTNKASSFAELLATNITARQANGTIVPTTLNGHGEAVLIGTQSLMRSKMMTNGFRNLMVYGPSGTNYQVQSRIGVTGTWTNELPATIIPTNLFVTFSNVPVPVNMKFYRTHAM